MVRLTGARAPITSRANPRVRAASALRDRHERATRGLTVVDGAREIARAIATGAAIVEAFVCEELVRSEDAHATVNALEAAGIEIVDVGTAAFERVAFGDRADGIVAVVRPPSSALADLAARLPPEPLVVVVEGVEKPGNLGAIIRSADGAGASAIVAADPRTDLWNPNVIRASVGTIFAMPLGAAPTPDVIAWLRRCGIGIVTARVDAVLAYDATDLTGPRAIVLGSEANGLSEAWEAGDVVAVRLPMLGVADSLNVSTAAAILLYESRRQRDSISS